MPNDDLVHGAQAFADTLYSSAWNISRHKLIAGASQRLLQDAAKTNDRIVSILAPLGTTELAEIAAWADEVKRRKPREDDDPDTVAFLQDQRNKRSDTWHFVDLPLDCTEYSRNSYPEFTGDEDVVQIIHLAVDCLAGRSNRFSVLNALRLVVHLVGDVHQPLHVGCGYLRESNGSAELIWDPRVIVNESLKSDRGGNRLFLPMGSKGPNLHSYWDSMLGGQVSIGTLAPKPVAHNGDVLRLAGFASSSTANLLGGSGAAVGTLTVAKSIEQWATESLISAREAYKHLEIDAGENSGYRVKWEGKQVYDGRCTPILQNRLAAAARNLAGLLADTL